jgi:hypothetical protein
MPAGAQSNVAEEADGRRCRLVASFSGGRPSDRRSQGRYLFDLQVSHRRPQTSSPSAGRRQPADSRPAIIERHADRYGHNGLRADARAFPVANGPGLISSSETRCPQPALRLPEVDGVLVVAGAWGPSQLRKAAGHAVETIPGGLVRGSDREGELRRHQVMFGCGTYSRRGRSAVLPDHDGNEVRRRNWLGGSPSCVAMLRDRRS